MTQSPSVLFVPEPTADGSFTFFSPDFGEWFHSRHGAYQEAVVTYVQPTHLALKAQQPTLHILDVCYGLGYNTAAALDTIWRVNPACNVRWYGLELDPEVPQAAIAHNLLEGWSEPIRQILQTLATAHRLDSDRLQAQLSSLNQELARRRQEAEAALERLRETPRDERLLTKRIAEAGGGGR